METLGDPLRRRLFLIGGVALTAFLLGLCVLAAVGRYEFVAAGKGMYRGDRWTGEMVYVEDIASWPVKPGS